MVVKTLLRNEPGCGQVGVDIGFASIIAIPNFLELHYTNSTFTPSPCGGRNLRPLVEKRIGGVRRGGLVWNSPFLMELTFFPLFFFFFPTP